MGILDIFKKFTGTAEPETTNTMFPNAINSKEEYENKKTELEETALADTVFWDKMELSEETKKSKEYKNRKKFLELWDSINKRLSEVAPKTFSSDKIKNIQLVLTTMRLGHISYYEKENINKLAECRRIEGQIQQIYGTTAQATNCFMQVLFLDMIDDALNNRAGLIAPKIYKWAFSEKLSEDEFKKIFIFNAENVIKNVRYDVPIAPEDAWKKIKDYQPS